MHYGVVDDDGRAGALHRRPAAGPAAAARHGVHRELRDPQRLPAVLGPGAARATARTPRASTATCRAGSRSSRGAARPRDIRWFEADPTYVLHFVNAYEDGDEIVLDGFFQGDPNPPTTATGDRWQRAFRFLALDRMQTRLHRWRLQPRHRRRPSEEQLSDSITEFGMINGGYAGRAVPLHVRGHRQARLVPVRRPRQARPPDRRRGALPFGDGVFGSETAMAPRRPGGDRRGRRLPRDLTTDMNADAS